MGGKEYPSSGFDTVQQPFGGTRTGDPWYEPSPPAKYPNASPLNDHNNHLIKMIAWVEKIADEDIQINVSEIIRDLTDEEKADRVNHHKCKQDFIYSKYPAELTKLFLSDPAQIYKKRASPTDPLQQYSFDYLRKYHDAILFGANRARQKLPEGYGQEMKVFLDSLKKRNARAKKEGIVEEKQADPISLPLYKLICRWAIQTGDTFFWAFTVCLMHFYSLN